ncbi:Transglutaminase-like superfamily protein [Lutibacter oricola]|uniref:Transglutaminase-like superfamily protein n=1 Tax=Lutibacter oricola TaxID=762486 RepID=A0A1H2TUK4_9FLAO|nr:DUF3857 domain-containing protein [Lutibacter oricola]SDW46874.1 Transglutaminase-like superfamily protein [Lutibacter oricola]
MKKILVLIFIGLLTTSMLAQDYKFGKVSKAELEEKVYPLDSSANAVVLYKSRRTSFNYLQGEGFQQKTEIHERIKIYNKEGYKWATKLIKYYSPDSGEKENVSKLIAKTYVLENGKIKEYKIQKNQIFTEKKNKYWAQKKITMPNLSDGCIIEWKYDINSPYRGISKVELQYAIPIKKVVCRISIPEYFKYNVKHLGYLEINKKDSYQNDEITLVHKVRTGQVGYNHTSRENNSTETVRLINEVSEIDMENVPAILEEDYVDNINNYKTAIHYELASVKFPNDKLKSYSTSWEAVAKTLYKESDFGGEIEKRNYFKNDLEDLVKGETDETKKALLIFEFVKQKVKWNNYFGLTTDEGVKQAYKKGTGNIADINLMLTAMLQEAGLNAYPVVSSTRNHGIPIFPTLSGLNYVLASAKINGEVVLFDASEKNSKPNILPQRVINWNGLLVGAKGNFDQVSLLNTQKAGVNSTISAKLDADGEINGMCRTKYTNYYEMLYRDVYGSLNEEDLLFKLEEANDNIEIEKIKVQNKKEIYKPLSEMFSFTSEDLVTTSNNKIFVKPMLFNCITENKFKLKSRDYPVDFTTKSSKRYSTSITIPEGYEVESLPENIGIGLPENYGVYKFQVVKVGNKINTISDLSINTVIYPAKYYQELKEFYKLIVKKNAEQVVLKKV